MLLENFITIEESNVTIQKHGHSIYPYIYSVIVLGKQYY